MTEKRKADHLRLCAEEDVEFTGKTTLLEDLQFLHEAVCDLSYDDIRTDGTFLGKRFRYPLLIEAMTGGTREAGIINRDLAHLAEEMGIALGLGSQRAMLERPEVAESFQVRDAAPNVAILGNLGLQEARKLDSAKIESLMESISADGICIHLNVAMELVQPEGERNFRDGYATIERLARDLGPRIIIKETGCGISRKVGRRLKNLGVRWVDAAGAGGTSWTAVECLRSEGRGKDLGRAFRNWGIPTAASVAALSDMGLDVIGSGGVRTGMDIAKCIALGARMAGMALPVLRVYDKGGISSTRDFLHLVMEELKMVMLLTGSRDLAALSRQSLVMGQELRNWLSAMERGD